MSLVEMMLRNAWRHRVRSTLTIVGISLGIATVIALGAVVQGMRDTAGDFLDVGQTDLMVAQQGASDFSFSTLDAPVVDEVSGVEGVEAAVPFLLTIDRVGSNSFFLTVGVPAAGDALSRTVTLVSGRQPRAGHAEVVLGSGTARSLGLAAGEAIEIGSNEWEVVGTYRSDARWLQNGAVAPLDKLQKLSGRTGKITGLQVVVAPGERAATVGERIERVDDTLSSLVETSDYGDVDQGFAILDAINAALSVLAVGIGAIGVMNTMFMSVFERTREIGVLRAIGWKRRRVMQMVVGESLLLCLIGAIVGSALGVAAGLAVAQIDTVASLMNITFPLQLFARGIAIGLVVGLVGAVFPALRATRLSPMEALRHE